MFWTIIRIFLIILSIFLAIAVGAAGGMLYIYSQDLPRVSKLEEFEPSLITNVYSEEGELIGEFFEEKRILVSYSDIPQYLIDATVAKEDRRFYQHRGIDFRGIARAGLVNLRSGKSKEGASTITQQLARVLFLTPEKRIERKIKEILLALQIEKKYSKEEILRLYFNQIYYGHGAYGVEAAAQTYFNKGVKDLTLAECAMLAGLPRSPRYYSPILYPERARQRRKQVLDSMVREGKISREEADKAAEEPFKQKIAPAQKQVNKAPYFVEYVRQYLEDKYESRTVHRRGLNVYTTVNLRIQDIAVKALRQGLRELDKRQGFRPLKRDRTEEELKAELEKIREEEWNLEPQIADVLHGIVKSVTSKKAVIQMGNYTGSLPRERMSWTGRSLESVLKPNDFVLVKVLGKDEKTRELTLAYDQEPLVEGAILALDPRTGNIKAMVGGYDFYQSKFNRATQALRQPGSSFKPFIYTTAIEKGYTPATKINDSPFVIVDPQTGEEWRPENYNHRYYGPTTLRYALEQSRNVVAVKLLRQVGINPVIDTARRMGLISPLSPYPSLALGSSEVTLLEMVTAYSTFANQGILMEPIFVTKITDRNGKILEENIARAQEILSEATASIMVSMLQGVIERGTAKKAKVLNRPLAGKTGTTNDYTDAWFVGFSPSLVTGVWVGFDEKKKLGKDETGGKAALPIWMDFMKEALGNEPPEDFPIPSSVRVVKLDVRSGLLANNGCSGSMVLQTFKKGTEPKGFCSYPAYSDEDFDETGYTED
jgi:penicillin-binding protein 1A